MDNLAALRERRHKVQISFCNGPTTHLATAGKHPDAKRHKARIAANNDAMQRRGPGSEPRGMRQQPLRDHTRPHRQELFAESLDAAERGLAAALLAAAGAPKRAKSQYLRLIESPSEPPSDRA